MTKSEHRQGRRVAFGGRFLMQYGVLLTFALAFVLFCALRPSTFPRWENIWIILNAAAIPVIIAVGATIPLLMNDFDLSFGGMMGFAGGTVVVLMSKASVLPVVAILLVLAAAVIIGVFNGLSVAYLGASSFIVTLAMASVLTGLEFAATGERTLYTGIPASFLAFGRSTLAGLPVSVLVAAIVAGLASFALRATVQGRWMYAIGGSAETARLAGVRVKLVRTIGFVVSALAGALGGILLVGSSAGSYPQAGVPFLLPAFSAAFLGTTLFGRARFSPEGTATAALLLQMVAIGLIQLNQPEWAIDVMNGGVLIVAVLFSRLGRGLTSV